MHGRIYRGDRPADRARPGRQSGHAQEPVRPGRRPGRDRRRAVPRAAWPGRGHDHQRRRPTAARSTTSICAAQLIDDRRGRGQRAPCGTTSKTRQRCRSRGPRRSSTTSPPPARLRAASAVPRRADRCDRDAEAAFKRERPAPRRRDRVCRSRQDAGRPAPLGPDHPRRPSLDGQDRARHQHRLQRRQGLSRGARSGRRDQGADDGAVVGFFSLEMSSEQLATRMLSEQAEHPVRQDPQRRGDQREDFDKVVVASQRLAAVPLFIDDTPALTIAALRTRARRLKRTARARPDRRRLSAAAAALGAGRAQENRVQEISEITRGLKTLAKELDVPVLALSQLSPRGRAARGQAAAARRPA